MFKLFFFKCFSNFHLSRFIDFEILAYHTCIRRLR